MSRRVLTLISTLTLIFSITGPAYAQNAVPDEAPEASVAARVSPKLQLEPSNASVSIEDPLKGATEGIFVIRLDAEPLATYRGGVSGLEGTSPQVTGAARLDATTARSQAYVDYLESRQATFIARMEKALGQEADVRFTYTISTNGLAVWLTPSEAARVARLPGVSSVRQEVIEQIQTDAGPSLIGAPGIWGGTSCVTEGGCGEGVIVGVLDTGINPDNPSFADPGPVDGYDYPTPGGGYLGECASDGNAFGCTDKLIGAYDFTPTGSAIDDDGHGSHTASTAAGNFVEATIVSPTLTVNRDISGVAPHAQIISYRVCDATGCASSGTIAAIDQAILDGVDVINFSVGSGSPEDPWSSDSQAAWLSAREAGIFVAHSAGNEGPGEATVGSPMAPWMLHTAATTHNRKYTNALASMTGGDTAAPADIEGAGFTDGFGPAPIVFAGDRPSAETDNPELCGVGTIGDFDSPWGPDEFDGEIVVCIRGDFGRVEKGANVLASGAGGYVLIDDGGGLVGDAHELPGVHITAEDGAGLLEWLASGTGHMATISGATLDESMGNADMMAGFSSRGPNRSVPDMIAPSVAAPGVDIIAADGVDGAISWGFNSGTSMASPHAAGAGALLVGTHPDWTPAEIQSALMTTGTRNVLKEDGATPATPFDMGSGRIQVDWAVDAGLLLDIPDADFTAADPGAGGDPSTLNLPSMANDQCVLECSWTRTVEATVAGTWDATTTGDGFGVTVEPASFTLAVGETQELTITADVASSDTGVWMFGDLTLGAPDGTPDTFMPIAVQASTGDLPASIEIETRRNAGSHVEQGLTAIEITELTVDFTGLAIGDSMDLSLPTDSDNGSAFDDLEDGVFWTTVDVPAGASRLVAETFESESPDLDLFVGTGNTPVEDNVVCVSASASADEFCDLSEPEAGTYFVLVQNWSGSGADSDAFTLSIGVVTGDEGNLLAEGPGAQPQLEPFDLGILFNEPDLMAGDRAYGSVAIGTDPASSGNVGTVPINLVRLDDDVTKEVSSPTAEPGDTLTYTITVHPNMTDADIDYSLVDFVPEGLTYVPGSASGGLTVRSDGALTWNGTMEKVLPPFYTISDSGSDPLCAMPLAGADGVDDAYVDLEAFGLLTESDIFGDTTLFSVDHGDYDFFGNTYDLLEFGDDGFAIFDSDSNYAGEPWTTQVIPNAAPPNNVAAMFWQDFEIVYDAGTNSGVTTAVLTSDGVPVASLVEYDNIVPWTPDGSGEPVMDFQIYMPLGVDESGPEVVFAYNNILVDAPGTIGVENADGSAAHAVLNNDLGSSIGLADGDAVCFDLTPSLSDPVVLTFDVTVDAGTEGTIITNEVEHSVSVHGSETETASVDVAIGDVTPPTDGAMLWTTNVLSSSLTLMWDEASDDRGVTGYGVYQDGVHLADVPAPGAASGVTSAMHVLSYDVTGLSPLTEYEFTVKAMDAQGNMSEGLMVSATTAVDFIDDDFSIFEDDIEWLYSAGITRGCNPPVNDMFCPNDNLTRGQLAAMIRRALDLPATTEDFFTDDDGNVFEGDINALAAAGITRGCNPPANDNFCPDDNVTRGQMAALLERGLDLPGTTTDFFTDDDGHIFEDSINSLAAAGITRGCNPPANDNYCPDDLLTRGQTAAFFRRALG